MNIRFTVEEENIVAIYAEDSRETTLENILAAMPYMDEDMRQLGCRFPAPRPCSFFVLAWTIRKPFLRV